MYSGWLYATVATPAGGLYGIFVTKDFGQNWTPITISTLPGALTTAGGHAIRPFPPTTTRSRSILSSGRPLFPQGNYNIMMAVDPTNPNVIYVGGTADGNASALVRIDISTIWDAHSLVPYSDSAVDNGAVDLSSTSPTVRDDNTKGVSASYLNLIRSPEDPFQGGSLIASYQLPKLHQQRRGR